MVETGRPDASQEDDGRRVAAFVGEVEVPAGGSVEVAVVLGQFATKREALTAASQRDDVGDGAERDEIEQVKQVRRVAAGEPAAGPQRPDDGDRQQERHADRREMAERRAAILVEAARIDHGERGGEGGRRLVMVDDDDRDARVVRRTKRVEPLRPAVDGDDQRRAARRQRGHRGGGGPVALEQPVGGCTRAPSRRSRG